MNGFLGTELALWPLRNLLGLFLISTFASNSNFSIHTPGRWPADVLQSFGPGGDFLFEFSQVQHGH